MFFEICTLALHLLIYVGELDNENENEKLLDDLSSTLSWSDKRFKGTVVNRALHAWRVTWNYAFNPLKLVILLLPVIQ